MRAMTARLAVLALAACAAWSAEPPAPRPAAPTAADAVIQRRAAEAVKAYAEAGAAEAPLEPALAERIAAIEALAGEGESFLAGGRMLDAGDRALAGADAWAKLSPAERTALGGRGRAAQGRLLALTRRLAGPDGLAVPEPAPAPPAE